MMQNTELLFEYTIRSYLGQKASHITVLTHSEISRKKWYRKVIKKIIREIQQIETGSTHKEKLVSWSENCLNALNERPYKDIRFTLCVLRLLNVLLGFHGGLEPRRIAILGYFQTPYQHFTETTAEEDKDYLPNYYDESTFSARKKLIGQLKDEGKTYFEISLILNLSEYEIKKIWKGL